MKFKTWDTENKKMLQQEDVKNWPFSKLMAPPYVLLWSSGRSTADGKEIFAGDLIRSMHSGPLMEIRLGQYQAFCPADRYEMPNVGFYAAADGYTDMPLGDPSEYAMHMGNIYEGRSPEAERIREDLQEYVCELCRFPKEAADQEELEESFCSKCKVDQMLLGL